MSLAGTAVVCLETFALRSLMSISASSFFRPSFRPALGLCVLALGLAGAALPAPVLAQTQAPSAQQMIEQLKAPRTRSLRNLSVEEVPGTAADGAGASTPLPAGPPSAETAAAAAGRPSLSLLIQFDFNSARVRPESQMALSNLSQALQSPELAGSKFAVEGHTDAKGSASYNQKLSEARALAVREFLRLQGVGEARLVASGKGSTELANGGEPFAPENRRVRIVNLD